MGSCKEVPPKHPEFQKGYVITIENAETEGVAVTAGVAVTENVPEEKGVAVTAGSCEDCCCAYASMFHGVEYACTSKDRCLFGECKAYDGDWQQSGWPNAQCNWHPWATGDAAALV